VAMIVDIRKSGSERFCRISSHQPEREILCVQEMSANRAQTRRFSIRFSAMSVALISPGGEREHPALAVLRLARFEREPAAHLRRILTIYASYYIRVRTHLSLAKDAPNFRRPQSVGGIVAIPILGGLHRHYVPV